MSAEYPGVTWYGAHPNNYTEADRKHEDVNLIVIHYTEGSFGSATNWFNDVRAQGSAHYTVRYSDGFIGQSVREKAIAWHAGNWEYNKRSIGIEHEGFTGRTDWITDALLRSSAKLCAHLCNKYGIPIDREHIIGHDEVPDPYKPGRFGGAGNHIDVGKDFPRNRYVALVAEYAGQSTQPRRATKLYFVYGSAPDQRVADAAAEALVKNSVEPDRVGSFGVPPKPGRDGEADIRWISERALDEPLGTYPSAFVGAPVLHYVPERVKEAIPRGGDLFGCAGKSYHDTQDQVERVVAEFAKLESKDPKKVASDYREILAKKLEQPIELIEPSAPVRESTGILGAPIFSQEKILEWGKERDAAAPWKEMVPHIYRYASQRNLGADFLCIQVALETAFGRYGGDSRPYNPAGIKLANATGDRPQDFEVPKTADEGARMLVNHWCAVLQKPPIGSPHGRYEVAKAVYASRPTITRIDQLGGGNWAADPHYATKLLNFQKEIGPSPDPNGGVIPNKLMDNVQKITKYFLDLERAGTTYHWWYEGHPALGEGPPAHAVDKPAPKPQDVKKVFCAGLGNLGLRLIGKPVPKNPPYDGGTGAWGIAYRSKSKKFVLSECREGDIAFRAFNHGGVTDQGHWAYVGPNGVCIQSYARHGATLEPGVTSAVTMSESHFSWGPQGGYIWRIPREVVWG